jgi:hypothetical protein
MTPFDFRMLSMQGYGREDILYNSNINLLARWTPFACGILGVLGLWLRSPVYLWLLGSLTLIGAIANRVLLQGSVVEF